MSSSDLSKQVAELSELVHRQSKVIGQTGKQVLEMQVNNAKNSMNSIDSQPVDTSDFITNDDIVQLVGELQGQLDCLEERSIRRTFNVQLAQDGQKIAPISNKDGDYPENFPQTLGEFKKLDDFAVVQLGEFYELIESSAQQEQIERLLANDTAAIETESLDKRVAKLSPQQLQDAYDDLARFVGLTHRRGSGW